MIQPMLRRSLAPWVFSLSVLVGCGGSTPKAEEPSASDVEQLPSDTPKADQTPPPASGESTASETKGEASEKKAASGAEPEPKFIEGMSVDDAIKAVPHDAQRMNLDSDVLGAPLMDQKLYEPCKLGHNQHFKVRVAIWNGKAVGIDVTPQPANPKAAECISSQVRSLTWRDKVPSLNTVEYSM
jgi:hypothetical protein